MLKIRQKKSWKLDKNSYKLEKKLKFRQNGDPIFTNRQILDIFLERSESCPISSY